MALNKAYYRIYRPFVDGSGSRLLHSKYYANKPSFYSRSFLLIQKELFDLFEYIEPSDRNLGTFSLRLNDLLMKICTEIETHFKAILHENKYSKDAKWYNISDYRLINISHRLSDYEVTYPIWTGEQNKFRPFQKWDSQDNLSWYDAYNLCKHDKVKNLQEAKLVNVLNAFAGLFIVYTAQFGAEDFATGYDTICFDGGYYEGNFGIGQYLMYSLSSSWSNEEMYDFDTDNLTEANFQKFDYDLLKAPHMADVSS